MPQIINMSGFRIYFEFLSFFNFYFNLGILLKTKINHTLIWVHVTFEQVFISRNVASENYISNTQLSSLSV